MASGSSTGRIASGSRSFDFASDDVLCSYDDLMGLDASNGKRPDSAGGKDFQEGRRGKPLQNVYCQQEGYNKQDMIFVVEKCMKKYTDNVLSALEGISGRLKQLEVYCYNLEKSMEEFRSDLAHNQNDSDLKLKSLEKHLQEVHRSVQILRDKQELAEAQKELAKLQLAQKESPDAVSSSAAEQKKDDADATNKQLVLALPQQQIVQPPTLPARVPELPNQSYKEQPAQQPVPSSMAMRQPPYLGQGGSFYSQQPSQVLNQPPQSQPVPQPQPQLVSQPEDRYMPQMPQTQDLSVHTPPQQTHVVSQSQTPFTNYPQQWPQQAQQQFPQLVSQPQQQTPTPAQYSLQGPPAYPPYQSSQPVKARGETFQGSVPMQGAYSTIPPPGGNPREVMPYGYRGPASSVQQPPPPSHTMQRQMLPSTSQIPPGSQLNKSGYMSPAPYPHSSAQGYSAYGADGGGRTGHSQPFYGGGYPPNGISAPQNQQSPPAAGHGHPFGELMEKAINMGYPRDVVAGALYRMEETGQPADFNVLLDVLNQRASGPAQRGWSG